jgi:ethanolamine utilization cobalamin adenosyltransferase
VRRFELVYYSEKGEMITEILIAVVPVLAGLIGVWVNLNSTVARLKSRVIQLELSQDDFKRDIKELLTMVHNIQIMIAKMNRE